MNCFTIHLKDYYEFFGNNGCDPTVDVYLPHFENKIHIGKKPNVIICPGGAYGSISERETEPIALKFTSDGYNAFVLKYSVAPHIFPTQICEVAGLMEIIYNNCEKWDCDVSKIVILGLSAGGHLAAHYSTMYDCKEIRSYFPESKPVNATVLCYPVITAEYNYAECKSIQNLSGKNDYTKEDIEKLSCEKHINELTPPTFIWHTSNDSIVNVMNSLLYAETLSKYKVPYELHIYPYGPHGLATADSVTNGKLGEKQMPVRNWLASVKEWLEIVGCSLER